MRKWMDRWHGFKEQQIVELSPEEQLRVGYRWNESERGCPTTIFKWPGSRDGMMYLRNQRGKQRAGGRWYER
jgi:hypothetical protein